MKKLFFVFSLLIGCLFSTSVLGSSLLTENEELNGKFTNLKTAQEDHYLITGNFKYVAPEKYGDITSFVHEFLKPNGEKGYMIYISKTTGDLVSWESQTYWENSKMEIASGEYSLKDIYEN